MEDAAPVVEILDSERLVEAVLMAKGCQVGGCCSVAEDLLDGVAGD